MSYSGIKRLAYVTICLGSFVLYHKAKNNLDEAAKKKEENVREIKVLDSHSFSDNKKSGEEVKLPQQISKENKNVKKEDPRYPGLAEFRNKIDKILVVCGDACNTDIQGTFVEGAGFSEIKKTFNCKSLFEETGLHDQYAPEHLDEPYHDIPEELVKYFSYNGRVAIRPYYIKLDFKYTSTVHLWKVINVEKRLGALYDSDAPKLRGSYGPEDSRRIIEGVMHMDVEGKRVLVIGSKTPWMESIFLFFGARQVVTVDYSRIFTNHPQLSSLLPSEFAESYLNGTLEPFDIMATFGSIEHSGMGRYGDGLHPWADLVVMARTWCVLKPGGMVLVGVPGKAGDAVMYNAHKCYGPVMYSHLFANFKYVWSSHPGLKNTSSEDCLLRGLIRPVIVAQKID